MVPEFYRIRGRRLQRLAPGSFRLEKELQRLLEANLETAFGVRFLATEFCTDPRHGGRMDSLGIDPRGAPVVIEYKRQEDDNVINQALFYLDWLTYNHGDFERLVAKRLGPGVPVDWSSPRVICVAADFTRYDRHAVAQIGHRVDLVQYCLFAGEFLMLQVVATSQPG